MEAVRAATETHSASRIGAGRRQEGLVKLRDGPPIDHMASKELRDRLSLSNDANDLDRELKAGEALNPEGAVHLAEISLFPVVAPA